MRDIIFRGKVDDENKKWVEGSLLKVEHIIHGEKYYIVDLLGNSVRVLPDTIGQYTGLCDKNGTKIFEGDIVESISGKRDYIGVVRYCKARFIIEWDRLKDVLRNDLHFWASERKLEVIGNIHENKELLEGNG